MRGIVTLLVLLAMVSGCSIRPPGDSSDTPIATLPRSGDSVDTPIVTTVAAVKTAPANYHRKFIQLRGLIDGCTPWGCDLLTVQPGTIPAKADFRASIFASLSFDFVPAPGSPTKDDSIDRSAELMQQLYRFSEVTLVGQYDATCALHHDPDEVSQNGKPQNDVIFLDHTGDLQVYRVLAVHKRWPSSAGALWGYKPRPLAPLPAGPAQDLFESFKAAALTAKIDHDALDEDHRAFVDPKRPDKTVLCICRAKACDGKWPSDAGDLVPAPANPYQCTVGIRTKAGWRFPPAWFE